MSKAALDEQLKELRKWVKKQKNAVKLMKNDIINKEQEIEELIAKRADVQEEYRFKQIMLARHEKFGER